MVDSGQDGPQVPGIRKPQLDAGVESLPARCGVRHARRREQIETQHDGEATELSKIFHVHYSPFFHVVHVGPPRSVSRAIIDRMISQYNGKNWLGEKDSNPHAQIQNLMSYP